MSLQVDGNASMNPSQDRAVGALLGLAVGDDANTTGAIAGQLAGARWGASSLPDSWREQLVYGDKIAQVATQLYVQGQMPQASHLTPNHGLLQPLD